MASSSILDDAHAYQIFGKHGEGFARSQMSGHLGERTIIAASLGKGLRRLRRLDHAWNGAAGGTVSKIRVAHAFQRRWNVAAIGAAPRVAATAPNARTHGATTGTSKQNRLVRRSFPQTSKAHRCRYERFEIGDNDGIEAARALLDRGFYTSAIFFPTVARGREGCGLHTADTLKTISARWAPRSKTC